jgi:protein-S-isoprenylcysteine O-methyltransferase Ste14
MSLSTRFVLPAALVVFFAAAVVGPVVRARARGDRSVVVHEGAVQRVIAFAMGLALVAAGAWGALLAALGPERVGVAEAPAAVTGLGWGLAALGFAVVVTAQAQMGAAWRIGVDAKSPTALVARGLFRVVRNPIYAGMLATLAGVALVAPCAFTISLAIDAALLVALQTRFEEAHLEALHGDAYRDYARDVGRFVPFVGRLR